MPNAHTPQQPASLQQHAIAAELTRAPLPGAAVCTSLSAASARPAAAASVIFTCAQQQGTARCSASGEQASEVQLLRVGAA